MDKDKIAQDKYGHPYSRLSAWAQADVNSTIYGFSDARADTTNMNDVRTAADEGRKDARIRVLEDENLELWDENTELKEQVETLRAELNLPKPKKSEWRGDLGDSTLL